MNILVISLIGLYVAFNFVISNVFSIREMKHRFIDGQCVVGKIATNIFYSPAWLLKVLKFVITKTIK